MDMEQLQCILEIVRHGTFLDAAEALNRSQSSVSKSVQRLEQELGTPIFERTTRHVQLTPAGEDVLAHAQQIVTHYNSLLRAVENHRTASLHELHIGSIYFGLNNQLIPLVGQFMNLHPSLNVTMEESTTSPLLARLEQRSLDVVFVSSMYLQNRQRSNFSSDPRYISCSFSLDPYYVIVNPNNPLAKRKGLSYHDLAGQRLITLDKNMDVYHHAINTTLEHYQVKLSGIIQCTTVRSALHMVSQNIGIAILTKLVLEESEDLVPIPLDNPLIRDTQMVIWKQRRIAPHINAFYQFVQENKKMLPASESL